MSKEPGYGLDEMIDEAWLEAAGRYTVDYGNGTNFSRVADLAARDFGDAHPELVGFVPFIAGALYQKLRESFQLMKEMRQQRESN